MTEGQLQANAEKAKTRHQKTKRTRHRGTSREMCQPWVTVACKQSTDTESIPLTFATSTEGSGVTYGDKCGGGDSRS